MTFAGVCVVSWAVMACPHALQVGLEGEEQALRGAVMWVVGGAGGPSLGTCTSSWMDPVLLECPCDFRGSRTPGQGFWRGRVVYENTAGEIMELGPPNTGTPM